MISIIALLISLLLPVLSTARSAAKSTVCLSNVRQLGLAFTLYSQDYKGRFVIADADLVRDATWDNWIFLISPYIGENRSLYPCPAYDGDPLNERTYMSNGTEADGVYSSIKYSTKGGFGVHTLRDIDLPRPSESAAIIEVWPKFVGLPLYKPDTDIWRKHADSVIPVNGPSYNKAPHAQTTTHLFHADGHASAVELEPGDPLRGETADKIINRKYMDLVE